MPCSHFDGKCAQDHVKEKRLEGLAGKELHGQEAKGSSHTFLNAAKEVAILLLLVWTVLYEVQIPSSHNIFILATVAGGWVLWRGCKSAYLAWNQLEYLHKIIIQEKYEIEHNREEEKEELTEMYRAKGLEGKLLEDVVDVLMSDNDRLLKVMIEEEFGLTLESFEHPLKIGVSACLGAFFTSVLLLLSAIYIPSFGLPVLAFILLGIAEAILASKSRRNITSSVIWTLAIGVISVGLSHFLIIWIQSSWLNI